MFKYAFRIVEIHWENEAMTNPVLDAIKKRRSVLRFEESQIEEEKVNAILEAGRWAPSWNNKQPWNFIVITDKNIKEQLSEVVPTIFVQGLKEAPICIAVVVNPEEDPSHFVEDGAVATQNMALATYSLGLHSCWIGLYDIKGHRNSAEAKAKEILEIPRTHRMISLLPIGQARYGVQEKERKTVYQLTYKNKFGNR